MAVQPIEVQTLYAELLERVTAYEAHRSIGHAPGTFVTKNVKGGTYYYFQHMEPGGEKRQVYLGRKDDVLERVAARHAEERLGAEEEEESILRLCAILRAGGIMTTDTASARVLRGLADAGVFRLGGVLVGTHAFLVIGNVLGVRWEDGHLRTQDVDVAASSTMSLAVPNVQTDVPGVLDSLEMGFLPVPALDRRSPSTSFKVRGQGLRVDVLTPAVGRRSGPVLLRRFNVAAQPLKYLDVLMEQPVRAAVVNGGATLVSVPDPARFALHKLIVATQRPAVMHVKREKDLTQAASLLEVLAEQRPGDLPLAWDAVSSRGAGWVRNARKGLEAMRSLAPEIAERVEKVLR